MYLYQCTRPDLGFAGTFLSRYLYRPGEKHLQAAKHTLQYLEVSVWIRYTRDVQRLLAQDQQLNGFIVMYALSDSGFAGCKDTSRSSSGCMILNRGVVAYYYDSLPLPCAPLWQRSLRLLNLWPKLSNWGQFVWFAVQTGADNADQKHVCLGWQRSCKFSQQLTSLRELISRMTKHVTVKVRLLQEWVQRWIIMIT